VTEQQLARMAKRCLAILRHAAFCLATTILIVGRLLDSRTRWCPT
jgi:hypothetical protein